MFDVVAESEADNEAEREEGLTLDEEVKQAFYFIY